MSNEAGARQGLMIQNRDGREGKERFISRTEEQSNTRKQDFAERGHN